MTRSALTLRLADGPPKSLETVLECSPPDYTIRLKLVNAGLAPHGFKALTNAPRRWSVRPNGGVLEPGQEITVVLSLTKPEGAKESLADDHHLILSLPLTAEEAKRLYEVRSTNAKASIEALSQDNPQVSQARLSPRLAAEGGGRSAALESSPRPNGTHAVANGTPLANGTPPHVAAAGDAVGGEGDEARAAGASAPACGSTEMSVVERVKDLQRRYSGSDVPSLAASRPRAAAGSAQNGDDAAGGAVGAGAGGAGCAVHAAAGGSGSALVPPPAEALGSADASGRSSESESSDGGGGGGRRPLLRALARLAGFCFDEVEPWLKWKVYDILFALLLVLLGRRLRHPMAQRAIEFVCEA